MELNKNHHIINAKFTDTSISQFYTAINDNNIDELDKTWNSIKNSTIRELLLTTKGYEVFWLTAEKGHYKMVKWLWNRAWEFNHTLPIHILHEMFRSAFNYNHPKIVSLLLNKVKDTEEIISIISRVFDPELRYQHHYYNDFIKAFNNNHLTLLKSLHEHLKYLTKNLHKKTLNNPKLDILGNDIISTIDFISKQILHYTTICNIQVLQEVYNIAKLVNKDSILLNSINNSLSNLKDKVAWQKLALKVAESGITTGFLNLHFIFDQLKSSNINYIEFKEIFNHIFKANHYKIFWASAQQGHKNILEILWRELENMNDISSKYYSTYPDISKLKAPWSEAQNAKSISQINHNILRLKILQNEIEGTNRDILKLKAKMLKANGYRAFHKSVSQNLPSVLEWLIEQFDPISGTLKKDFNKILDVNLQGMFESYFPLLSYENKLYYLKKYSCYHLAVVNGYTKVVDLLFNKVTNNELRKNMLQSNLTVTKNREYIATKARPYSAFHQAITIGNKEIVKILIDQAKKLDLWEEMLASDNYSAFSTAVILRNNHTSILSTANILKNKDIVDYLWTMPGFNNKKMAWHRKQMLNSLIRKLGEPDFINFSLDTTVGTLKDHLENIKREYKNNKDKIYQQPNIILSALNANLNPKTLQEAFLSFHITKTLSFTSTDIKSDLGIPITIKYYKNLQQKVLSLNNYKQRIFKHALYFPMFKGLGISTQTLVEKIALGYSIIFFQEKNREKLNELFLNKLEAIIAILYKQSFSPDTLDTTLEAKNKEIITGFDKLLTEIYDYATFSHIEVQEIKNIENELLELAKDYVEYLLEIQNNRSALYLTTESGELLIIYYKNKLYHIFDFQYGVIYNLRLNQVKELLEQISAKFQVKRLYYNQQYYNIKNSLVKLWQPINQDKKILIEIDSIKIELATLDKMGARLYEGTADNVGTAVTEVSNLQAKLLIPDNKIRLDPKRYLQLIRSLSLDLDKILTITAATGNLDFIQVSDFNILKMAKKAQKEHQTLHHHFTQINYNYSVKESDKLLNLLQHILSESNLFNVEELVLVEEYLLDIIASENYYIDIENIINTKPINLASTSSGRTLLIKNIIDIADAIRQGDSINTHIRIISLGLSIKSNDIEKTILQQFNLLHSNKKLKVKAVKGGVAIITDFANIIDIFNAINVLKTAKPGSMAFRDSVFSLSLSSVSLTTAATISTMPKGAIARTALPITILLTAIQTGYSAYSITKEYHDKYNLTSDEIFVLSSKQVLTLGLGDIPDIIKNVEAWTQRLNKNC